MKEGALVYEFSLRKISCERQKEIELKYKRKEVGNDRIDFLVEAGVIIKLKARAGVIKIYEAQLVTYLKATEKRDRLLLNFNVERLKEGIKRMVL